MTRADVLPQYRARNGETWTKYLHRVWPDLSLVMFDSSAVRARALADHQTAERLYFARQSFDICQGLPTGAETVEEFIAHLDDRGTS